MEKKHDFEGRFDELMEDFPSNDYRVTHTDLITGEVRDTARGSVIKELFRQELIAVLERAKADGEMKYGKNRADDCGALLRDFDSMIDGLK